MNMEVFKRIIDEIGQYVYRVNLYGFGEPFLYDKTLNMVRYASDRNISVGITSNFNTINDDMLEPIILSGLEHLVVSIDGIDQSSYQKYRVGGDFNRVINNLRKLQEIKKKMNKNFPILDWQFLVMKHNVSLRPQAEAIARELGMGMRYSCIGVDIQDESQRQEWLPEDEALSQYNYKTLRPKGIENLKTCSWLYRTVFINWDGGVSPCCNYYTGDKIHDFGNILEKTFAEIWNGHAYSVARKLVSRQILANDEQAKNNICRSCEKFF
jgi:radical SAM protein with 4Fe4S-binding SPASM domain